MTVSQLIAAVGLATLIGFAGGFYTKGRFTAAEEVEQVRADAKQTATNVVESVKQSTALENVVIADGAQIDKIKEAAAARVVKYQPKQETTHASPDPRNDHDSVRNAAAGAPATQVACPAGGGLVLDIGTVRLLNAARQGIDLGAAGRGDGEKPAAPGPGG